MYMADDQDRTKDFLIDDLDGDDAEANRVPHIEIPKSVIDNTEMIIRSMNHTIDIGDSFRSMVSELEANIQNMAPDISMSLNSVLSDAFREISLSAEEMAVVAAQTESMQRVICELNESLSLIPQIYIPKIAVENFTGELLRNDLTDAMAEMQRSVDALVKCIETPAIKWFRSFDYSGLVQHWQAVLDWKPDPDFICGLYLECMFQAHWCPNAILRGDISLAMQVEDVIEHTREKKNGINKSRTKKIDAIIFEYYTKKRIEDIKKRVRSADIPQYLKRIIRDCINAYLRKEYATPVIILSTQWENIICIKARISLEWRKSQKTEDHYIQLVRESNYPEIFESYYTEFINYNCSSVKDTIPDVPGRHSSAHGFFEKYPTRKAALNAILFTDFLLGLEPIASDVKN